MFWPLFWIVFLWQMASFIADRMVIKFSPSTYMMIGWVFGAIWVVLVI